MSRTPSRRRRRARPGVRRRSSSAATSARSSCPASTSPHAPGGGSPRRWRRSATRPSRPGSFGRGPRSGFGSSASARRAASCSAALQRGESCRAGRRPRHHRRRRRGPVLRRSRRRCPVGPAFLAIESGAPLYLAGVWRIGTADVPRAARRGPVAVEGSRRERIGQTLAAEAAAFERVIAKAPDQWGAVFSPIWPDLEAEAAGSLAADATGTAPRSTSPRPIRPPRGTRRQPHDGPPRSRRPPHPLARLRRHRRHRRDPRPTSSARPTSTSSRSPTMSGRRGARRPDLARDRGLRAEVDRRRGGLDARRPPACAVHRASASGPCARCAPRSREIHEQGGLAIPAHPLVPYPLCAQGWVLRRLIHGPDPRVRPDAIEAFNPTTLGRPWHSPGRPVRGRERAPDGRQQRRPRGGRDRRRLDDVPGPDGR